MTLDSMAAFITPPLSGPPTAAQRAPLCSLHARHTWTTHGQRPEHRQSWKIAWARYRRAVNILEV